VIVLEEGEALTVKSAEELIVRDTVVLLVRPPPVPWIVTVKVPVGTVLLLT
jgi:hypothetical protein